MAQSSSKSTDANVRHLCDHMRTVTPGWAMDDDPMDTKKIIRSWCWKPNIMITVCPISCTDDILYMLLGIGMQVVSDNTVGLASSQNSAAK